MQFCSILVVEKMPYLKLESKLCFYLVFISIKLSPKLKCGHYCKQPEYELSEEITWPFEEVKLHFELFLNPFRTWFSHWSGTRRESPIEGHLETPGLFSNSMTLLRELLMLLAFGFCEYTVLLR